MKITEEIQSKFTFLESERIINFLQQENCLDFLQRRISEEIDSLESDLEEMEDELDDKNNSIDQLEYDKETLEEKIKELEDKIEELSKKMTKFYKFSYTRKPFATKLEGGWQRKTSCNGFQLAHLMGSGLSAIPK